ncbi:adenosylcobinamide amidohydrolase [Rhizobium sp. CAU 1783]
MKAPEIICIAKTLAVRFAAEQAVLSWSLTRPGFVRADTIAWLEVSEADLPIGVDPAALLRERLTTAGYGDAVQMMTSRDVTKHHQAVRQSGEATGFCLATVGLANAGRVGADTPHSGQAGTINLVAHIDQPLDEAGLIEALSIATEARTAAVIDLGWTRDGLVVTGTGTDCIAVACPVADQRETYAGLHTGAGRAIGGAVYDAVLAGGREWVNEKTDGRQRSVRG